jgi:hypothetical protein
VFVCSATPSSEDTYSTFVYDTFPSLADWQVLVVLNIISVTTIMIIIFMYFDYFKRSFFQFSLQNLIGLVGALVGAILYSKCFTRISIPR